MNENKVIGEHQVTESSPMSGLLRATKLEFQLGAQPSSVFPPSSDPNHRELMAEAINCPLPVAEDSVLEASQSGIGPENQAGDISLGSESFLQSLESIPLPPLVQNETTLYNPLATYSDIYTNASEAKRSSCSAALQQELLQAWGNAGPPMNSNTSPGVDFGQVPCVPRESPVVPPRCLPRAVRSRGRGRGLRRKFTGPTPQSRVGRASQPSFSPRCGPPMSQGGIRSEAMTTPARSYIPVTSNHLPLQAQANSLLSRGAVPVAQACDCQSSETAINSEENQANEKMNAYIEKFSSESCELFGSSVSVDTSRKPSTLQEAISMYIDFLVLENEKRTRISCCNFLPMPLDFHKEDYYHEIMCQPIAFPTPKFRDWLRLYNVDIEITDPDGQTVSHTTFPPSANFGNTNVSIPTSLHMINWQQTRGIPTQPGVVSSPRFNMPAVFRGRPKSRALTGHALRLGHSGFKGVAGHPFEFVQNSPADQAANANVQFLRGNVANCTSAHSVLPCSGMMHQFQTISLPALGSMQYLGQAPTPLSVPRACSEIPVDHSPQMVSSFQHAASAKSSNYYRMAPVFSPGSNKMAWKSCCTRPNVLLSDFKTTGFPEVETENMAACLNKLETVTRSDNTVLVPSATGMLPPFSSFAKDPSANQSSYSGSKTCQTGETSVCDNLQTLSFVKEQECANVSSLSSVTKNNCLSLRDSSAATQYSPQDTRYWNYTKMYSRPGSGPVIKEMVDQGSQTELDKVITEDPKAATSAGAAVQEGQSKERGFGLDSAICSFSCTDDFDESRKTEDQLNSEILLTNASIILNGSLEVDESIQETTFTSQDLLSNSQASTLGDLDGLALPGDCGIQSFMTVSLSCSSEDPEKPTRESCDCCNKADVEYDDSSVENDCLNKSSDLVLEVGSNVEINTEGEPTVGERSDERWMEPKRKRARFSRVGNRQVVGGQDPWPNICINLQQKQATDQNADHVPAFENGKELVNENL